MGKISKGHDSLKSVDGVTVLFFAHRLRLVCICSKFHENILYDIKVIEQTRFS